MEWGNGSDGRSTKFRGGFIAQQQYIWVHAEKNTPLFLSLFLTLSLSFFLTLSLTHTDAHTPGWGRGITSSHRGI